MQRKFISRRSFLKCAGMGAVTAAAAGLLAGCGGSDSSSSSTASSAAAAEPADPNKPYAGVTLYYAATDTEATGPEMQDIVAMVKEKTGINIEFNIIPKADTGEVDKRLVSLQAGDALDIVYGTVAQLKVFYDAGVLEPLDELASAASYDKAQFGMFVCGGWAASMLPDTEKYPRDWQCVILPMPYPEGQEPSTLTVPGCYAVPSTSKNKEAAFEAVRCIAENQYTLGYGRVPARVDLSDEETNDYIENGLVPTYAATDNIPAEQFKAAWFDPTRKVLSEKIVGTADTTISQIWTSEAPLYGMGQQDLDTTMQNILDRSNEAIKEAQLY